MLKYWLENEKQEVLGRDFVRRKFCLILRRVQTTKKWLRLFLIYYSRAESTHANLICVLLNLAPGAEFDGRANNLILI